MAASTSSYALVAEGTETEEHLSLADYRNGLQKGNDDVKLSLLRSIVTSTLNGRDLVRWRLSRSLLPAGLANLFTQFNSPMHHHPTMNALHATELAAHASHSVCAAIERQAHQEGASRSGEKRDTAKRCKCPQLLAFYWEVCPKYNEDGKLKQEMILVCNAIRNDLQHPNEFIRGSTLRLLQKISEPELLEPLVPTARACLVSIALVCLSFIHLPDTAYHRASPGTSPLVRPQERGIRNHADLQAARTSHTRRA